MNPMKPWTLSLAVSAGAQGCEAIDVAEDYMAWLLGGDVSDYADQYEEWFDMLKAGTVGEA